MTYSAKSNPNATNSELDSKRIITHNDTNLPNGITTPKENELSSLQRDKLIEQFVEIQLDNMDTQSLYELASEYVTQSFDRLTDNEIKERIKVAESNNGRWFNVSYSWGDGDSLDRERVRDIILEQPQFSWSS